MITLHETIRVVPFFGEHLRYGMDNLRDNMLRFGPIIEDPKQVEQYEASQYAMSGFARGDDGNWAYLGSMGFYLLWAGVAEVWGVFTTEVDRHKFSFHRTVKEHFKKGWTALSLHRLQAGLVVGDERALRWAESFGFKPEGLMKCYGPDKSDYWRMACVK